MKLTKKQKKRFEKLWDKGFATGGDHRYKSQMKMIKQHLAKELSLQRKDLIEEVEKVENPYPATKPSFVDWELARQQILNKLKNNKAR